MTSSWCIPELNVPDAIGSRRRISNICCYFILAPWHHMASYVLVAVGQSKSISPVGTNPVSQLLSGRQLHFQCVSTEILKSCTKPSIWPYDVVIIEPIRTNFDEISSKYFPLKMHLKMSSAKWRPFYSVCYFYCPHYQLALLTWTAVTKVVNKIGRWFVTWPCHNFRVA